MRRERKGKACSVGHQLKSLPCQKHSRVATCSNAWLVVGGYIISDDCFLLNPISTKKIHLPSLTPDFSYDNCVLSSTPDNPECVFMFLNFDIGTLDVTFCKPGDVEWTRQDFKLHDEDDSDCVRSVEVH
ncbi:hypothetical protein OIU79_024016 [Salix purpurea]|uniref:KIB1-4 beta-propeller domain-containing protein n=1 Tax=Salix purpurea TaxID=77065 RepID=A0A9Q0WA32_SALPP|nr:hypothetical protein OIU79_024016 [Salix purpurea]